MTLLLRSVRSKQRFLSSAAAKAVPSTPAIPQDLNVALFGLQSRRKEKLDLEWKKMQTATVVLPKPQAKIQPKTRPATLSDLRQHLEGRRVAGCVDQPTTVDAVPSRYQHSIRLFATIANGNTPTTFVCHASRHDILLAFSLQAATASNQHTLIVTGGDVDAALQFHDQASILTTPLVLETTLERLREFESSVPQPDMIVDDIEAFLRNVELLEWKQEQKKQET